MFPKTRQLVDLSFRLLVNQIKQKKSIDRDSLQMLIHYLYLSVLCSGSTGKRHKFRSGEKVLRYKLLDGSNINVFNDTQINFLTEIFDVALDTINKVTDNRFYKCLDLANRSI